MNDQNLPIAEPYSIGDDSYGVVGAGFDCSACKRNNWWRSFEEGEILKCERCGQEHYVIADYDY